MERLSKKIASSLFQHCLPRIFLEAFFLVRFWDAFVSKPLYNDFRQSFLRSNSQTICSENFFPLIVLRAIHLHIYLPNPSRRHLQRISFEINFVFLFGFSFSQNANSAEDLRYTFQLSRRGFYARLPLQIQRCQLGTLF